MAVGAATKSAGVTNDPILIQSTEGSNVEDPMPIGLLSKKRKTVVDYSVISWQVQGVAGMKGS